METGADAVVIGGGIVGLAIADALAVAGKRVVLLERGRLAEATTGNSFAWINATAKTGDAAYHRLNAAGLAEYRALAQRFGAAAIGLGGIGGLHWGAPGDIDRLAARLTALDYPHRRVAAAELRQLEPGLALPGDVAGLIATADRWIDAPRCARVLARAIAEAGGAVREHAAVTGFLHADGGLTGVHTYAGTIRAGTVVVAAGIETAALVAQAGGIRLPLDRVPGALVDLPADVAGGLLTHSLHPPAGADDGIDGEVRPGDDGGLLVATGRLAGLLGPDADGAARRARVGDVVRAVAALLPALPPEAALGRARLRIGVRPIPADQHTVAGPVPGMPGLWAAVTHSGVTLAPLLGRLLAQEIAGGAPSPLLDGFRPARFAAGGPA